MKLASNTFMANLQILTTVSLVTLTLPTYAEEEKNENSEEKKIEVIEVTSKRNQANTEMTEQTEELLSVAGIGNDPLAAVYSLPGVLLSGGDRSSPAVRGSSPDDNAFYIDDMSVGYIFHLFGDSIFNEDVLQDFTLHPAAFGSQYGDATGGVFDVKLRDPRQQDLSATIDLSMLKSGFLIEGETFEEQAFYVSYRKSQIHLFLPAGTEDEGYTIFKPPVSEDYQGKYQWLIGDAHKLTFSASGAKDSAGINISESSEAGQINPDNVGDLSIGTQFDTQTLSWQYFGAEQKIMQLVAGHTVTTIDQAIGAGQFVNVDSEVYSLRFSSQISWLEDHQLGFGIDYNKRDTDYRFDLIPYFCTETDPDCNANKGDRIQDVDNLNNQDAALYVHDIWQMSDHWMLTFGVRAERFEQTDESFVHPRVALDWYAAEGLTVKAKMGTYSRSPDIVTSLNKLGNPNIKSPKSTHYSLGFDYDLNGVWFTSVDIYHKTLTDLPRSADEYTPVDEVELRYTNDTSGDAQGIEWLVRRERLDGWFGWASISWSQSERTDDLTNITSDYYLDTPLVGNIVANYDFNERWDFGLRFTVRSGAKYTPIESLRDNPDYEDSFLPNYGELNSQTLPVYHRLDLETNYKTTYWGYNAKWTFAVINAMARKNVSGYSYQPGEDDTYTEFAVAGEEDIGIFPYIGLKMTF